MNGMTTEILPAGRPRAHGASLEEPLRKAAASAAAGAEGSPGWSSDLGVGGPGIWSRCCPRGPLNKAHQFPKLTFLHRG